MGPMTHAYSIKTLCNLEQTLLPVGSQFDHLFRSLGT